MSLIYFHLRAGDRLYRDPEGSELLGVDEARLEAIISARTLIAEDIRNGRVLQPRVYEIMDDVGMVVAKVDFSDVLRAAIGSPP